MLLPFRIEQSHILASQLLLYMKPSDMPTVMSTIRRATMHQLIQHVVLGVDFGPEVGIECCVTTSCRRTQMHHVLVLLLCMGHGMESSLVASATSSFPGQIGCLEPSLLVYRLPEGLVARVGCRVD